MPTIYTIGHSTHPIEEFIAMLHSFKIQTLVDVRSLPGSSRYPQFNQENLEVSLPQAGIKYVYQENLGGRRKTNKNSKNMVRKNPSFRGYADYMETEQWHDGLEELKETAQHAVVAYMCSEAVWRRCHRSMISDALKADGWTVRHIMGIGKKIEHPYTAPARIVEGKLTYHEGDQ